MKTSSHEPVRWRDAGADRDALEDRAAALESAAAEVAPLDATALARIRTGALVGKSPAARRAFQILPVRPRVAWLVALLLLGSATTAVGGNILWRRYLAPSRARVAPTPIDRPAVPPARRGGARPIVVPPPETRVEETVPPPAPSPIAPEVAVPRLPTSPIARAVVRSRRARSVAATTDDELRTAEPAPEHESHLLARALIDLRQRRDARAALAALDEYDRAFPSATLRAEAASARLEAVIQLEDWKTALGLLDGTAAFGGPLGPDLLLTRAELRARADRCAEALLDFTNLLDGRAGPLATASSERALYGRAICFGRLRQDARARNDLVEYRQRFPRGHFAADVDRLLGGRSTPEAP